MRKLVVLALLCFGFTFPWSDRGRQLEAREEPPSGSQKQELGKELVDRSMRERVLNRALEFGEEKTAEHRKILSDNLAWLEDLVKTQGWPGISLVGEEATGAAWLMVQHADNVAAQKRMLPYMEAAASRGDFPKPLLAFTVDLIRLREGKAQLYGTQFADPIKGVLEPIENPEGLDQRRTEMGLPPIQEYIDTMLKYQAERRKQNPS